MELSQNKLKIKQKAEMLEVFTGFETSNKYRIMDESDRDLYYAFEESNFFLKQILGTRRSLKLNIIDNEKNTQMTLERPFFFLKEHVLINGSDGQPIGQIKQTRWFLTKEFEIYDKSDNLIASCISKIPHIWTFNIFKQDQQVGQILKKWSGVGKEMFTDADNFFVDFGTLNDSEKELVLAAAFAIDLRCFETKKR